MLRKRRNQKRSILNRKDQHQVIEIQRAKKTAAIFNRRLLGNHHSHRIQCQQLQYQLLQSKWMSLYPLICSFSRCNHLTPAQLPFYSIQSNSMEILFNCDRLRSWVNLCWLYCLFTLLKSADAFSLIGISLFTTWYTVQIKFIDSLSILHSVWMRKGIAGNGSKVTNNNKKNLYSTWLCPL